jgi:hypothetical protein
MQYHSAHQLIQLIRGRSTHVFPHDPVQTQQALGKRNMLRCRQPMAIYGMPVTDICDICCEQWQMWISAHATSTNSMHC